MRVRVFCKLVVLLVVMAFNEYFIPKALKWRCNDQNNETRTKNFEFKAYDSISKINSILKIK